ncbi:hypothetical protein TIFTF001_045342 [Ficus carica]|uniref:F-box/LRR-repeat protein 15/At3g58940/PEG3-like LRR domain-containing protein n=1 Tax=Ficus carica TaxID=3494 RepID=A0AA87YQJ4_FICCA|nr:hypothetical protein TIFTF001_045342 [Ficus carica]
MLEYQKASMRFISDSVLTRFKFDIEYYGDSSTLDDSLSFAIRRNIEEMELGAKPKFEIKCAYYCLPEAVLNARWSLLVLKLDSLKLNGFRSVTLPCLKSLSLTAVKLDNHILTSLLSGCPSLEKFLLKEVETRFSELCHTVEAINLESFVYSGSCKNIDLSACKGIRNISRLDNWLHDQSLEDIIFGLPLLESLTLSWCYALKRIKICCQHLKSVRLEKTYEQEAVEFSN